MNKVQKLELTWVGKNEELHIEPRILVENKELSNISNDPNTENMLIHGDNLLALKALEQKYVGQDADACSQNTVALADGRIAGVLPVGNKTLDQQLNHKYHTFLPKNTSCIKPIHCNPKER